MRKFAFILLLIIFIILLYARYIGPKGLLIHEYNIEVNNLPDSFDGFKIVQFSDFLYPNTTDIEDLKNIVQEINDLNPDIVVFTGDLIDRKTKISQDEIKKIIAQLKNINPNLYKYSIYGDNDIVQKELYNNIMQESEFILLDNKSTLLFYKDSNPIKITGVTNMLEITEDDESIEPIFHISLLHQPDLIININLNSNIFLAGHSLGGYISFPFIDPLIKKDGAKVFVNGYYKYNNSDLYVSNGLGTEKYKLRIFNKPSLNFYRLEKII